MLTHTAPAIVELDADALFQDPYPILAELRERGPAHRVRLPGVGECWLIVGHAEGEAALRDGSLIKNWQQAIGRPGPARVGASMITSDPPDHARLRRLVSKAFTARRIAGMAPQIEEIADRLLDRMAEAGDTVDLIAAYAYPLPITVISELIGVPAVDRAAFADLCGRIFHPPADAEASRRIIGEVNAYFDALIGIKRAAPDDSLLSALIRATDDDADRLTHEELRATIFLLVVAGHVDTTNLISTGVLTLLDHPDQLAALRADWELLPGAVEEIVRLDGPQPFSTRRFTTGPWQIGDSDTVIPGGETVVVALGAGNHDPAEFPDGQNFDIRRTGNAAHLGFGHGIHYCLGAPLARLQVRIALHRLLTRHPGLALAPVAGREWRATIITRGLAELPVVPHANA